MSEARHGAVGGEQAGGGEAVVAPQRGHGRPDVELVDVVGAVRLTDDAVHVAGERVELERQVEVGEAVVAGDAVPVHPRVLGGDGHGVGPQLEPPVERHEHAVRRLGARHGQRRHGGGGPGGAGVLREEHRLAVDDDLEAVDVVVPGGGLPGADVEAVGAAVVEEDGNGLDPGEVARHAVGAALADEVRVDVEVAVGDDAEVGVPPAMEVEGVAVAADEPRVAARPRHVAHCTTTESIRQRQDGGATTGGEMLRTSSW
ncbi:Os11g0151200 [Oryza sativa Japonica Group]|uniref:Os11g0151200 protein n=2 Tax=Oryza sativa subsp. japonica TaxID=39947 RepID=Q0IUK6_ORYSJ|nr:hypothetical protein EE612_053521 [Oryza sativa]BAF27609.1 Os11g0151200 [Oryza sativa Japonica Group]BAT12714.1 Os11g0151200 [Oryza sativa Japonica Group]|eukprot:NP_001065764.1 Os11g0151200 [Oryza sativa Japonica Group]